MFNATISQWSNWVGEVHFLLAIGLFFLTNWIGKHSYSIGYVAISLFTRDDDAPAFNYVIRVFTPIVYLIISSALFYHFGLDRFVTNFYLISLYYIAIRLLVNFLQERIRLINWPRQLVYYASIFFLSWAVYKKFISVKANMLPDFNNVANEMWIIIILFVYQIINNLNISSKSAENRRESYLSVKYSEFKNIYGNIIDKQLSNDVLKAVAYAILIYENFNRSKMVRMLENVHFLLTRKPHSLGVMQFPTNQYINDRQSVVRGVRKILKSYKKVRDNYNSEEHTYFSEEMVYSQIISKYNGGIAYQTEVVTLVETILSKYYKNTTHTLNPAPDSGIPVLKAE